jgi:hypothetical protein
MQAKAEYGSQKKHGRSYPKDSGLFWNERGEAIGNLSATLLLNFIIEELDRDL